VFNMSQYLGSFVGGTAGGWLLGVGPVWAYAAGLLLCVPWAWAAALLDDPRHIEELRFPERRDAPVPSSVHRPDGIYDLSRSAEGELVVRFSRSRWAREDLRAWLAARRLIAG
jgi:hypothetical protein